MGDLPAVPLEDDERTDERTGGLFGAAPAAAGRWVPDLLVDLVGYTVGTDLASGSPLVVDGVSVEWGRQDLLDQPDMSTARLSLFTPDPMWAVTRDLVGLQVRLAFRGTPPPGPAPQDGMTGTTFQRELFRGRVQTVRVVPKTVTDPATGDPVHGSLVHLGLSSILADLANRTPTVAWPAETLGARADRIAAAATDVLGSVLLRPYWRQPQVAPVAVKDQDSLYDHLVAVFDSCGHDRMTHYPSIGRVQYMPRREYGSLVPTVVQLWWDVGGSGQARAAQGVYARGRQVYPVDGTSGAEMWALYVDADDVEFPAGDGLVRGPGSSLTRVRVDHPDAAASYAGTAGEVVFGNEASRGVRTMNVDSLVAANNFADTAALDLADWVQKEGAAWGTDPLRFSTSRTGGFATLGQAIWMLSGAEIPSIALLAGSDLHARYGIRPVVGLIGGTIDYRGGHWDVELFPSPILTPAKQHSITWEEIDDGSATYEVRWDDEGVRSLHESLTYEDLAWVGMGLAVDVPPTSTEWDFYA